jgi:hypothetical protein
MIKQCVVAMYLMAHATFGADAPEISWLPEKYRKMDIKAAEMERRFERKLEIEHRTRDDIRQDAEPRDYDIYLMSNGNLTYKGSRRFASGDLQSQYDRIISQARPKTIEEAMKETGVKPTILDIYIEELDNMVRDIGRWDG